MRSPRDGSPKPNARRTASSAVVVCGLLLLTGCQAQYGGMTLPSMHYLNDDVQFFERGPHFRWARTQAATQRARMEAMDISTEEEKPKSAAASATTGPTDSGFGGKAGAQDGAAGAASSNAGQAGAGGGAEQPPDPGNVPAPGTNADKDKAEGDKSSKPIEDANKPKDDAEAKPDPATNARAKDNSPF